MSGNSAPCYPTLLCNCISYMIRSAAVIIGGKVLLGARTDAPIGWRVIGAP